MQLVVDKPNLHNNNYNENLIVIAWASLEVIGTVASGLKTKARSTCGTWAHGNNY